MVTKGVFITGTDTGVGKTEVTCQLAAELQSRGRSVGLYKPACSGAIRHPDGHLIWEDVERLAAAIPAGIPREWICPQRFMAPVAPPVAARQEGTSVDGALLRSGVHVWTGQVDFVLVEGAGGWKSPLTMQETVADVARDLNFPVLIVAANRLGMLNQTILTVESVKNCSLPLLGIVVNSTSEGDDESCDSNSEILRQLVDVPVWGPLPWLSEITRIASPWPGDPLSELVTSIEKLG